MRDGNRDRIKFESHGMLGIELGRSEYTNGMIFYNLILDRFNTSSNYLLGKGKVIGDIFLRIQ